MISISNAAMPTDAHDSPLHPCIISTLILRLYDDFPYTSTTRCSNFSIINPDTFSQTVLTAAAWNGEAKA